MTPPTTEMPPANQKECRGRTRKGLCTCRLLSGVYLQNFRVGARWVGKGHVFKLHQAAAGLWSLGAVGRVFGFSVHVLEDLFSPSHSLHEACVHRRHFLDEEVEGNPFFTPVFLYLTTF